MGRGWNGEHDVGNSYYEAGYRCLQGVSLTTCQHVQYKCAPLDYYIAFVDY